MKKIFLVTILLILTGCTVHPVFDPATGLLPLVHRINSAIKASGLETNIGISVRSARTGKTLYAYNDRHLFNPASNNKIYTATAALQFLTPAHRYRTGLYLPPQRMASDSLSRLTLVAAADPDFYPRHLDSLATVLAQHFNVVDTIMIDNTILDTVYYGNGWMWDEGSGWYSAQIDGMIFNDNCVDFHVSNGEPGSPPDITIIPPTQYIQIDNKAVTTHDTIDLEPFSIRRHWWEDNNKFDVWGHFFRTDSNTAVYYRNIHDPARFTGTVLKEMLEEKGTLVRGPILEHSLFPGDTLFAYHESDSFLVSLANFLKESDNLSGESYLKLIGHYQSGNPGSWPDGLLATKSFLADSVGLDTSAFSYVDGSGISRYNYSAPRHFTQLLYWIYQRPGFKQSFLASLPVGGWDGTLENRMQTGQESQYVHAKTGTLSGASCLSGYILKPGKEPLVFSIMMNGYVDEAGPYRDLQDEIVNILLQR
ncbi:MAG: D-alanyl-D-alanine carboxypeptidase/D-alanyl-D-alanine-endopeptidase [Fidelibacterota bacterium]